MSKLGGTFVVVVVADRNSSLIKLFNKFVAARSKIDEEPRIFKTIDNLDLFSSWILSRRISFVKLSSRTWPGVTFNCKRCEINGNECPTKSSKCVEIRIQSSSETVDGNLTIVRIPFEMKSKENSTRKKNVFNRFFYRWVEEKMKSCRELFFSRWPWGKKVSFRFIFHLDRKIDELQSNFRIVWSTTAKRVTKLTPHTLSSLGQRLEEL